MGRAVRYLNVVLGAWLLAVPWLLSGWTPAARGSDLLAGGLLILLSLPRGIVRERYGPWDRWVK